MDIERRYRIPVILPKKPLQIHHLRRRRLFQRTRTLYPSKSAPGRTRGLIVPTASLSLVRSCRCFGTTGSTVAGPGLCAEMVWEDGRSGEEGLGPRKKINPPLSCLWFRHLRSIRRHISRYAPADAPCLILYKIGEPTSGAIWWIYLFP